MVHKYCAYAQERVNHFQIYQGGYKWKIGLDHSDEQPLNCGMEWNFVTLSPPPPPPHTHTLSLSHTQLALSYPVDETNGKAEFDKTRKCLTVTLPVLPSSLSPSLPPPPPPTTSQSTNQMTESESHDSEIHESTNHVAPLESHDPDLELTNQIAEVELSDSKSSDGVCEMKPCDPEGQELTNEIAEQESHDLESKQPTNQITTSNSQSLPTTTADSETVVTSSDISTNHSTEPSHMTWTSKGDWVAPSFTYRQDNERVVFVLHSSGVKPSTLVHHHDNHQVIYSTTMPIIFYCFFLHIFV